MKVHSHGPTDGPGLACREQLLGACQLEIIGGLVDALEHRIREFLMPSAHTDWQAYAQETLMLARARELLGREPFAAPPTKEEPDGDATRHP